MFGIEEREELAKILIFEAKYASYEMKYKRVVNDVIVDVINKIIGDENSPNSKEEIIKRLKELVSLNKDEEEKIINAIDFAEEFKSKYCIFRNEKFGGIIKEIGNVARSNINNNEEFFNNIKEIIKTKKKIEEGEIDRKKWDEIKNKIELVWKDYFKNNLAGISENNYANYHYYYEQYRELSRLKWFFSDIEDYTKSDRLIMIDAFSSYKGMGEEERFHKAPINKRILYKNILYDLVFFVSLIPPIHNWLYNHLYKGHILVRKYEIPSGNIPKMHQCFRLIRNSVFSISTEGEVYLEEYCNSRMVYDKFSDFFEVADSSHLLQILHHFKIYHKTEFGCLTLITIKPEEFEKLGFPYRTINDLATELSHIYFTLEDTGKEDPKAKVRIIKHHNRDEETKEGEYYDLCKRHGWLYLEGCGYEEEEPNISEILKGISANGREKLEEEIKDIIELEKGGRGKKEKEHIKDTIRKILKEEGLSAAAIEMLLRRIWKKPEEVLHKLKETEKLMMEEPYEIKEYVEHGKEIDAAIWIFAMAGSYVLIKEALHLLGL